MTSNSNRTPSRRTERPPNDPAEIPHSEHELFVFDPFADKLGLETRENCEGKKFTALEIPRMGNRLPVWLYDTSYSPSEAIVVILKLDNLSLAMKVKRLLGLWSRIYVEGRASLAEMAPIPKNTLGLHSLYDAREHGIDANSIIDIVVVHGLGGDPYTTWTDEYSGKLWLKDFLPLSEQGKKARIMTFGYDAQLFTLPFLKPQNGRTMVFAEELLNDLSDVRRTAAEKVRPIIFICHSMGGIVVKAALNYARLKAALYGSIVENTKALVFFSTPHMGASAASWLSFLTKLTSVVKSSTNVQDLETWSRPLIDLSTTFAEIADNFAIMTFYEKLLTHGVQLVNQGSSQTHTKNESLAGLRADHLNMCKFASIKDLNYTLVLKGIETIMIDIQEQRERESITGNVLSERLRTSI